MPGPWKSITSLSLPIAIEYAPEFAWNVPTLFVLPTEKLCGAYARDVSPAAKENMLARVFLPNAAEKPPKADGSLPAISVKSK